MVLFNKKAKAKWVYLLWRWVHIVSLLSLKGKLLVCTVEPERPPVLVRIALSVRKWNDVEQVLGHCSSPATVAIVFTSSNITSKIPKDTSSTDSLASRYLIACSNLLSVTT